MPPASVLRAAVLLLGIATARAAAPTASLASTDVGAAVYAVERNVTLVAPSLRSRDVADALRRAARDRGVRVFLLVDQGATLDPGGYVGALSLAPNVQVRVLRGVTEEYAVLDARAVLRGPLVWNLPSPLDARPTTARRDPAEVRAASAWFNRAWRVARPYTYRVDGLAPPARPSTRLPGGAP